MIEKPPLCQQRIRNITGSFAFIEPRFLRDGFLQKLTHHELVLYLFLVLASDRNGLSFYCYDKICTLLQLSLDEYLWARNCLIEKELIAFDGNLYQVLSLPQRPPGKKAPALKADQNTPENDPATIQQLIRKALGENHD